MKRKIFIILSILYFSNCFLTFGENAKTDNIVLTPYVFNSKELPGANKVLEEKLKQLVTKYGLASLTPNVLSPFIITANSVELSREATSTVPSQLAVSLSLTFYIGNGEDGTLFSSFNKELKGVGSDTEKAYISAFKKININDPELGKILQEAKKKIVDYYEDAAPRLLAQAATYASEGNYDSAYSILLLIPATCSQYQEAQRMLMQYVAKESDSKNESLLASAKSAWSASPDRMGAAKAEEYLSQMNNVSPAIQSKVSDFYKEMSTRIQKLDDREALREEKQQEHLQRMQAEALDGAIKVAVAQASRPVYKVWWW